MSTLATREWDTADVGEEIRTAIGPNADYYLAAWHQHARTGQAYLGRNWAAFFLDPVWLAYRKMYLAAAMVWVIIGMETLLEDYVFIVRLDQAGPPSTWNYLIGFAIALTFGMYGNRLYVQHVNRLVDRAAADAPTTDELRRRLSKSGGTSILAAAFGSAGIVLAVILLWGMAANLLGIPIPE